MSECGHSTATAATTDCGEHEAITRIEEHSRRSEACRHVYEELAYDGPIAPRDDWLTMLRHCEGIAIELTRPYSTYYLTVEGDEIGVQRKNSVITSYSDDDPYLVSLWDYHTPIPVLECEVSAINQ
jgi:hypothetical protein